MKQTSRAADPNNPSDPNNSNDPNDTKDPIEQALTYIFDRRQLGDVVMFQHRRSEHFVQYQMSHRGSLVLGLPFQILKMPNLLRLLDILERPPWYDLRLTIANRCLTTDVGSDPIRVAELTREIFRVGHRVRDLSVIKVM